ncbi:protein translocase subunit SecF [Candidatus Saccharibacteria bacterium]|nr:protein translocase subunit SecF [Candidatus Saccharibacteria bacterium]
MVNFMRYKSFFFLLSAAVLVPGVISLLLFGLKPSIDFTGGTLWEIEVTSDQKSETSEEIREVFEERGLTAEVQESGEGGFIIKTQPLGVGERQELASAISSKVGPFEEVRFETLGPRLGGELLRKALTAVVIAIVAILLYVAYRFRNFAYGAVAILAMFHDTLVLLGVFSLLGYFFNVEVGTLFVTAVLTTLSFSVHDTIVVFDRIREIRRKTNLAFGEAVNQAVGETLVRSINNSLTIIFMLAALFALGGETLRFFVLALLVGTISGTYSSTFNAAPLLVVWESAARRFNFGGILRLR